MSQKRREAVQRGKKLPTFTGTKIKYTSKTSKKPKAKKGHTLTEVTTQKADPHIHISPASHTRLTAAQTRAEKASGKKVSLKDLADEAITSYWKKQ